MNDSGFYKKVARIAIPVALQGLVSSSLTLLDNMMVSSLSETALSATNMAGQLFQVQWMMVFGICSGCSTFLSQFWGAKDMKNIRKVIGVAGMTTFALSMLFFCAGFFFPAQVLSLWTKDPVVAAMGVDYLRTASVNFLLIAIIQPLSMGLRGTEQTKIPMYISIGSFLCDVVFNYILIFGRFGFPQLGVKGAAIATVIARSFEFTVMIFMVFIRKNILNGPLRDCFAFDGSFVKRIYKNCGFTTINETLWSGANAAMNAAYGHIGTIEYAAFSAAGTISNMFLLCMFSIGDASLIMVGSKIGEGNKDEAFAISKRLHRLAVIFGIFSGVMIGLLSGQIIRIFDLSEEGFAIARSILMVEAVFCPVYLVNGVTVSGILRAGGDTRFAAIAEILIMWLISVPLAFLGAMFLGLPIVIVILMTKIAEIIKLVILLRRFLSAKWLHYMIEGM